MLPSCLDDACVLPIGATKLAVDRIKIANIGPIGGLKTGFHSLDKLCGSHTANQVFWSVHLVLSRFATRSPGLRMQTFYLSGKYQDQNILGTLFRHP